MTKENLMQETAESLGRRMKRVMVKQARTSGVFTRRGFFIENEKGIRVINRSSMVVGYQSGLAEALILFPDGLYWLKSRRPKPEGVRGANTAMWDYSSRKEIPDEEYLTNFKKVQDAISLARKRAEEKEREAREKELKK